MTNDVTYVRLKHTIIRKRQQKLGMQIVSTEKIVPCSSSSSSRSSSSSSSSSSSGGGGGSSSSSSSSSGKAVLMMVVVSYVSFSYLTIHSYIHMYTAFDNI